MAGGLRWNFQFSPLSDGAASSVQSKSLAWDGLGKGLEKLTQLGQKWASQDVDEFYKNRFARASDEQKMQWLQNGNLIAPEHAQQVSPQLRETYRNAAPEAAAQWAKTADEWQQRRFAQNAWKSVATAVNQADADPHGQSIATAMMRAATADRSLPALAQAQQLLRSCSDDAALATALKQFDGSAEQVRSLGRWLDPNVQQLQYGAPDARGFAQAQAVSVPEDQRAQQLHWGQQARIAAAQQLLHRNPTAALAMLEQVNQQRADSMKYANATARVAGDGGNDLAWRSAQLSRQDAQLAESRRHHRAGEKLQAQRLQWELNRPAGAASGAGKINYDPLKLRQIFTEDVVSDMGQPEKRVNEKALAQFNDWLLDNPQVRDMNEGLLLFQRDLRSRQKKDNPQNSTEASFNPQAFVSSMMERGADVTDVKEQLQMLRQKGLSVSDADFVAALNFARRQGER